MADTHIPRVADDLPVEVYNAIKESDMLIHAGDFVESDFYERLKALKTIKAVCGNMDDHKLRQELNQKEIIEAGGYKIGLIHGYGASINLMKTVRGEFGDIDAIIFGHSQRAINTVNEGVLFFNPGSPTDKIFTDSNSYGILDVTSNGIKSNIIKI